MSELRIELDRAIARAQLTKPVDCTCDGLHTSFVDPAINLPLLIETERSFRTCPAEIRALVRISERIK